MKSVLPVVIGWLVAGPLGAVTLGHAGWLRNPAWWLVQVLVAIPVFALLLLGQSRQRRRASDSATE